MSYYDVAVIGSGPAGSVAALELARAGRSVVLIDPGKNDRHKIGESLPAIARPLLSTLGLLHVLEDDRHLPSYGAVSAWGSPQLVSVDSLRDPHGSGWHLDRALFDQDLRECALAVGVDWLPGNVASLSKRHDGRWQLLTRDSALLCSWIVHAAGRSISVSRALGATRTRDDDLVALYGWYDVSHLKQPQDSRHTIEATADGWWYSALLPNQTRAVAHYTDGAMVRKILRSPGAESWGPQLAKTELISEQLQGASLLGTLKATEACGSRLDHFVGDGWVAAGDAAISFDPLSSQGMFNALYSGMKAGRAVAQAMVGSHEGLRLYGESLETIRSAYLRRRDLFYRAERRWPDQPFWSRFA